MKALLFTSKKNSRLFGCGLAKGDWGKISKMIDELWVAKNIDVVVYKF